MKDQRDNKILSNFLLKRKWSFCKNGLFWWIHLTSVNFRGFGRNLWAQNLLPKIKYYVTIFRFCVRRKFWPFTHLSGFNPLQNSTAVEISQQRAYAMATDRWQFAGYKSRAFGCAHGWGRLCLNQRELNVVEKILKMKS